VLDEGFLKRMEFHLLVHAHGKTLDGEDGLAPGALRGIHAGQDRLAIHQDGTRGTFGFVAADLGACQVKPAAQERGEGLTGNRLEGIRFTVDSKVYV
jgi:hypothetical protein